MKWLFSSFFWGRRNDWSEQFSLIILILIPREKERNRFVNPFLRFDCDRMLDQSNRFIAWIICFWCMCVCVRPIWGFHPLLVKSIFWTFIAAKAKTKTTNIIQVLTMSSNTIYGSGFGMWLWSEIVKWLFFPGTMWNSQLWLCVAFGIKINCQLTIWIVIAFSVTKTPKTESIFLNNPIWFT